MFGDSLKTFSMVLNESQTKYQKGENVRECIEDLRMVFRDPTDQGVKRTKETPGPDVLIKKH